MSIDAIQAIAYKELSDKLKSRWVLVIAVGFTVFTMVIAYFGAAPSGITGFHRLDATIASLTSLVIYFIPILALTLGGGIIADEREKGTLEIFLASPVSVGEFIAGKFIGLSVSLAFSTLIGFGLSGIVLLSKIGLEAIGSYLIFIIHSILLGMIFLSISFLISIIFYERAKVIAFTVFLWLFYTILYDLGLIGLLIVTKGSIGTEIISFLLMINPVDVYRVLNFMSIGEAAVFIGLASVEFPAYMTPAMLWLISGVLLVVPLFTGYFFFRKKYMT